MKMASGLYRLGWGIVVFFASSCIASAIDAPTSKAFAPAANIYTSKETCAASRSISSQECDNAFANARAELDEKAPRFQSRAECEKFFKRCMITGFLGGKKVELGPVLSGVEITSGPGPKTVLPHVEDGGAELALIPRQIARPETGIVAERRTQALKAWKLAQENKAHPDSTNLGPNQNAPTADPFSPISSPISGLKPSVLPH